MSLGRSKITSDRKKKVGSEVQKKVKLTIMQRYFPEGVVLVKSHYLVIGPITSGMWSLIYMRAKV